MPESLPFLSVSPLYAALCGIWGIILAFQISLIRLKLRQSIGDGGNAELERLVRIFGNFTEYVPLALVLLVLVELSGFSAWVVHTLGLMLLFSRMAHAFGLYRTLAPNIGRAAGMLGTWGMIKLSSLLLILGVLFNLRF